ncbi:hypothetical protein HIM_05713 [Hirsutella minnesotensis 3608]|uniref:Uncharacterized protein n=1 Tax=Hirsutella minnesotensis 3608 TaxID=1043627 RepID=A0A0F8A568_9HYPO|nr:hypothetical protein HIM_05713 [Hirsutella minnesotensis 3608]
MEVSNKLVDLTLVSKYHPVANYSYPRNDSLAAHHDKYSPTIDRSDRSSFGSQASAPGLIDDRTDSEVSVDDDYQYHTHTAELWDSFWQPGMPGKAMVDDGSSLHPKKHYPALIPSPRGKSRRRQPEPIDTAAAWPLPDGSPRDRSRKPAAAYSSPPKPKSSPTYSAFPKSQPSAAPISPLLARASRQQCSPRPVRPPRPADEIITPCIRVVTSCTRRPVMAPSSAYDPSPMTYRFPPISPTTKWLPPSPVAEREFVFSERTSSRPRTAHGHAYTSSDASVSSAHLALEQPFQPPQARIPRHCKSIAHLVPPAPEPQPHSVFEYDSDSDGDHGRSFFRFHKRNDSDGRRSTKSTPVEPVPPQISRRPLPQISPPAPEPLLANRLSKSEAPTRWKRQGHDVFGRMLGRRSR